MYKFLESDRLVIRPIHIDDKEFMFRLVNSAGWLTFIGNRNINTSADAGNYIQKIIDNEKYFYSVFARKDSGEPIGVISFIYRENYEYPDFGFAILPEFERKGYAFEAGSRYLHEIIQENICPVILGISKPENHKSLDLLKRLGFEFMENRTVDDLNLDIYSLKIKEREEL